MATLNNTIVAGGTGGAISGNVSGSNNLVDDAAHAGGLTGGANGNLVGVDPLLAPLGSYGGPTPTMPPLPGSPALDAGSTALAVDPQGQPLAPDQRGLARVGGAAVDIGAVEAIGLIPAGGLVVDNTDPGYSEQGTAGWWFTNGAPGGYGGSSREVYPGDGSHTATWQAALPTGTYNVEATWLPLSGLADNAPYRIYEGNTLLRTVFVNQQRAPSGADTVGGVTFQHLAYVTLDGSGPLRVVLGNDADGVVQADAVRFVTAAAPSADLNWAGVG